MLYSLDPHMKIKSISWSPDSRYISAVGMGKSQLQLLKMDTVLYDKILSIHDALSKDRSLW
jgi:hypothetical protein